MSNLVEIKKRIASISSTIKVTKVMQMIATAKVAKIKQTIVASNKYNDIANAIIANYLKYTENSANIQKFLRNDKNDKYKNILIVLTSSDKGTCGSINANIFKEFSILCKKYQLEGCNVFVCPVGKKAKQYLETYFEKLNVKVIFEDQIDAENCNSALINQCIDKCVKMYSNGDINKVCFLYHKFKNIITCNAVCEEVLPLDASIFSNIETNFINLYEDENTATSMIEFFVRNKFYCSYTSNLASILSSRMNAMDNATKNGQEIIDELRIKYNKSRQANITSELSDIVSGFEAIS